MVLGLILQNGTYSSSHHTCIPGSSMEGGTKGQPHQLSFKKLPGSCGLALCLHPDGRHGATQPAGQQWPSYESEALVLEPSSHHPCAPPTARSKNREAVPCRPPPASGAPPLCPRLLLSRLLPSLCTSGKPLQGTLSLGPQPRHWVPRGPDRGRLCGPLAPPAALVGCAGCPHTAGREGPGVRLPARLPAPGPTPA